MLGFDVEGAPERIVVVAVVGLAAIGVDVAAQAVGGAVFKALDSGAVAVGGFGEGHESAGGVVGVVAAMA